MGRRNVSIDGIAVHFADNDLFMGRWHVVSAKLASNAAFRTPAASDSRTFPHKMTGYSHS
jgi:hypothetical protein